MPTLDERMHDMAMARESLVTKSLADVVPRNVIWQWPNKLARGKLNLLAGMPDVGKSTITIDVIARTTSGDIWPFTGIRAEPKNVLLLTTEDDIDDTIAPRLIAAGADMSRVFPVQSVVVDDEGLYRGLSLAQDIERLQTTIEHVGDVGMIVIDPLSGYLGAQNSHGDADVRAVLIPFCDLAQKTGVCVLAIAHLNKNNTGQSLLHRLTGSGAIGAVARTVHMALDIDGVNYFAKVKNNLIDKSAGTGLTYTLDTTFIEGDNEQVKTSRINWTGVCEETAQQLIKTMMQDSNQPKRTEAETWLRGMLEDGPKAVTALEDAAKKKGIAWRTLERLKEKDVYRSHRPGFSGGWMWYSVEGYDEMMEQKRLYKEQAKG
jgi:putative DNA primase/helicase